MPNYRTDDIRNLTFVGHAGSGKTTLTEALLEKSGMIGEAGTIERGNTTTDFDPLEKEFQSSLDSAIASIDFEGIHINIIDTPGFPDFRGPALTGLAATETAVLVINAQAGIEMSTRRLMRRAKRRRLCRVIVINKIDAEELNLEALVRNIREEFGPECLPINLPAEKLSTVRDCFFGTEGETDIFSLADAHEAIIDQVVEVNEALMEKYLEGEELSREELHDAFEQALREGHLVPICFTSALTGAGLGEFLRLCKRLLPNPAEGNPPMIMKGEGENAEQVEIKADPYGARRGPRVQDHQRPLRRQAQHLPHLPGHGPPTRSCTSATAASRSRSATCSRCRAASTTKWTPASRATSARWPRSTRSTTTRSCTIRTMPIPSTCSRWVFPSRCTASPSAPRAGARSRNWPRR